MKNKNTPVTRWASRICTLLFLTVGLLYISAHVSLVYPATVTKSLLFENGFKNDFLLEQRRDPRIRAFLSMIAYAEGTLGPFGYRMHYTHIFFYDFSDHPREIICANYGNTGKQLCSSAAGRYQFLQKTWDYLAHKIQATNFGPLHQDRAAIYLLYEKDALELIKRGDLESAIERCNKTWASLPGSPYGQRPYSLSHLKKVYHDELKSMRGGL